MFTSPEVLVAIAGVVFVVAALFAITGARDRAKAQQERRENQETGRALRLGLQRADVARATAEDIEEVR